MIYNDNNRGKTKDNSKTPSHKGQLLNNPGKRDLDDFGRMFANDYTEEEIRNAGYYFGDKDNIINMYL